MGADSTALGTASTDAIADSTNASTLPGTNDPAAEAAPSAADIEIEKRKARAAKFGVPYVEPTAPSAKPPKTKSSASANGAPKAATTAATAVKPTVAVEDPEVLARRRAKFGPLPGQTETTSATEPSPPSAAAVDPAAAERARIDEEKKKARQERFKVQPAQPSSEASAAGLKRQSSIPLEQEEPAEKKAKA
ncbi:hypothetical protein NliqN6_1011 [Naganishia liquefaciens]|uniref:THO1-MOS11 C-terminal domain-containing protein n=1 Tax=Naganishia liquefaciens TaxID=104408 RepID=A0A8H3YCT7_9TREE|nr:hypothetical protein NliqN6_1011 [Naganishia liquefaciens]